MSNPEGQEREKAKESLFKEIISENIPKLEKELDTQVHEIKRTPKCKTTFSKTCKKY